MPVPYQIIPEGSLARPKVVTQINDNTEVVTEYAAGGGDITAGLFVFTSPKGRDNQIITIKNGLSEFMNEYGLGPYSVYGQPLLNAYAAAKAASTSNAMLHCLRVTPEDATYSYATLYAKYKQDSDDPTHLKIHFVVEHGGDISDLSELDSIPTDIPVESSYDKVKLFTIAYRGRGSYGKNIRFRITSDTASDKNNNYKNYNLQIYRNENILELVENFNVAFVPDAIYNNTSIFAEDVLNDVNSGSSLVALSVNYKGFEYLYETYIGLNPDTNYTLNDFDVLLGIDKYTREKINNLSIETAEPEEGSEIAVDLSAATGIALLGGSNGSSIAITNTKRKENLDALYLAAFKGDIDRNILSKNRYPTTFIFDADFSTDVKLEIISLATKRKDCVAMIDFGTEITTKESIGSYYKTNFEDIVNTRVCSFEPYCMKVKDPYSYKTVTVTSTYWLASEYFTHINNWNGKHRPLAGNRFGIISGYIGNSVYPVFDDDLDAVIMDDMADKHCNVAKYNQNQVVVRSMQNTAQDKMTALSELNNVLILLDVKRDCERLVARYEYDFAEPEDIARFNVAASTITDKYAAAQVRSITARFDKNSWEAERNILHLYVEMVNKDLVKTTIVEIDVNRSSTEV